MADILVLTTGGTIGADPVGDVKQQPHIKTMPQDNQDRVYEALLSVFIAFKTRCIPLELRDSNYIDEAYRANIATIIQDAPETRILVTHGTDTLLKTADYLYRQAALRPALRDKSIIITGAMVPLANGNLSDGYQNIQFSLEALLKPGSTGIAVVLCGYDDSAGETGAWKPRLYLYEPGKYERYYHPTDDRLSGMKRCVQKPGLR